MNEKVSTRHTCDEKCHSANRKIASGRNATPGISLRAFPPISHWLSSHIRKPPPCREFSRKPRRTGRSRPRESSRDTRTRPHAYTQSYLAALMIRQLGAPRRVARWARGEGRRARGVGGHCRGPGRLADQSQREDFFMPIYGHGVGRDAGRGARGAARPSILNRGAFPPPIWTVFEVASSYNIATGPFRWILQGENAVFGFSSGGERGRSLARATPAGSPRPHSRAVARQGRSFRGESPISSFNCAIQSLLFIQIRVITIQI